MVIGEKQLYRLWITQPLIVPEFAPGLQWEMQNYSGSRAVLSLTVCKLLFKLKGQNIVTRKWMLSQANLMSLFTASNSSSADQDMTPSVSGWSLHHMLWKAFKMILQWFFCFLNLFSSAVKSLYTRWLVHPKVIPAWSSHNKLHSLGWNNNLNIPQGGKIYNLYLFGLSLVDNDSYTCFKVWI